MTTGLLVLEIRSHHWITEKGWITLMEGASQTPQMAICPYCHEFHVVLDGTADLDITIVCSKCGKHYHINTLTQNPDKKRPQFNDFDVPLPHKLKCPYGCGYTILNRTPVDTIISVMCPKDNRFFRANLLTGRTWGTASQKKPKGWPHLYNWIIWVRHTDWVAQGCLRLRKDRIRVTSTHVSFYGFAKRQPPNRPEYTLFFSAYFRSFFVYLKQNSNKKLRWNLFQTRQSVSGLRFTLEV